MRTTLTLDDDVAAEVERLRADEQLGLSEAVNLLARRGMSAPATRAPYTHESFSMGARLDLTNIGAVLDLLDHDR